MNNDCQLMKNYTCDIDVNPYVKNCEYDMCSHVGLVGFESAYLCQSMAAYAYDCARLSGKSVGAWMSESTFKSACSIANLAVCPPGQQFMDCSKTCLKTCRDLSLSRLGLDVCGTSCNQGKIDLDF